MNDVSWSSEQNLIIEAKAAQRLLIDAGPGTGKTAVACARIAHLINGHFCAPHNIIVVSFTNTAVYEIRERIKTYLTDSNLVTRLSSLSISIKMGEQKKVKLSQKVEFDWAMEGRLLFY